MRENFAPNVVNDHLKDKGLTDLLESLCEQLNCSDEKPDNTTQGMMEACQKKRGNDVRMVDGGHENEEKQKEEAWRSSQKGGMTDKNGCAVHRHRELCNPVKNMHPLIPVIIEEGTGTIWCVQKKNKRPSENILLHCKWNARNRLEFHGAWYFQFSEVEEEFNVAKFDPTECLCGLMMQHRTKKTMYHVIRLDWKELMHDSIEDKQVFAMPRHSGAKYSSYKD